MKLEFSRLVLFIAIVAVYACQEAPRQEAASASVEENVFPARAADLLRSAETIEVLALMPVAGDGDTELFHGYPVVRTVTVADADRRSFAENVIAAIAPTVIVKPCFEPHHGIRAVSKNGSVDLVICLMCKQTRLHYSDDEVDDYVPNDDLMKPIAELFAKAG
jgi:hypothetical protein